MEKASQKPEHQLNEEEDVPSFTCQICVEPVPSTKRFDINNKCGHHSFCMDCIERYIKAKVEEYGLSEIKCPGLECDELLHPFECQTFLSADVFVRWCDVLCDSTLLQYPRVHCPFRNCSSLMVDECGGRERKTKCPNCKKWLCFECKTPWHAGYRCDESNEFRDRNDVLFGELMERMNWKRCPACNRTVELVSGCRLVKCRCGTSFCYQCGRRRCECKIAFTCYNCCCMLIALILGWLIFSAILLCLREIIP